MAPSNEWFRTIDVPQDGAWGVLAVDTSNATFVIHREDKRDAARIVLISQDAAGPAPVPTETLRIFFQRIHRVALAVAKPPLRLPPAWSEFHHANLVTFFACPHGADVIPLRWIVEIGPERSDDLCFWKLTDPGDRVYLPDYRPHYDLYRAIVADWANAWRDVSQRFQNIPVPPDTAALQAAIDLDATTFGSIVQGRTYTTWLEHLTPKQQEFMEWPADQSVKLRGPSGSGKTLALELKCLRELYNARASGRKPRILFATHSWTLAEQVDSALRMLDESGTIVEVDVYPLLEIARSGLPGERQITRDFQLLGEDSLTGRRLQLKRIDDVLDRLLKSDWLTYHRYASKQFQSRVQAARGSAERNSLVWDLMNEFASVLSAQGILPGVTAERRYLALQRPPWMMPLETDADKRFVLQVYTEYVTGLKDEGLLTADQLINDFLNYLETFTWNMRREKQGYDLIFVDELHLFSEQERLVLHYLTRSASEYPKISMALDPRQAPSEVYGVFPLASVARGESGRADLDLGTVASVQLSKIHRFTPEILGLIQHIHRLYPALDLGPDWEMDLDSVQSGAGHGDRPLLFQHATQAAEVVAVAERINQLMAVSDRNERIAVILVDALRLPEYEKGLRDNTDLRLSVIQSRDDVEILRYARKSVIVAPAEYLAGLQFDRVVVVAIPGTQLRVANLGYQRRRLLTLLYLGISRATRHVELHVNDESGDVPEILESALRGGALRPQRMEP